jgi:Short C-terminal domain
MMRRRRPVLRAATMAGGAAVMYHAGKSHQANTDQNVAQDQQIQDLQYQNSAQQQQQIQQQAAAPPPPPPGGMSQEKIAELQQLGQLHDSGVLTDEEFAAQKAKILNG